MWTIETARNLCINYNNILSEHNMHVALTGSVLFYGSSTKDLDIIIYPRKSSLPMLSIQEICKKLMLELVENCTIRHATYAEGDAKAVFHTKTYDNRRIDLFILR